MTRLVDGLRSSALALARRFVELQGIDRGTALGGRAFTALIPLLIVYGAVVPRPSGREFSSTISDRLGLSGASAASVQQAFAPRGEVQNGVTFFGILLLVVSALSFTRALQRLYQDANGLPSLGLRANKFGALWLLFVGLFITVRPIVLGGLSGVLEIVGTLAAAFALWLGTPYLLLGRRLAWQRLVPTAALTAAGMTLFGVASVVWMPHTVETSARQFGVIGVAFALLGWLVGAGLVLVVAATGGAWADDRLQERFP